MHRWKKIVIPALAKSSHSFCHFSCVSSAMLLIRELNGSLLKTILAALSLAASLSSRLASSFPTIPTWTLTHDKSIFQFARSRLVIFFAISSMRWLWFLVFLIESNEILKSVNKIAVRVLSCGIWFFPIASRGLVIAKYSSWLYGHLVSSLKISCVYVSMYVYVYACMYIYLCMYICCMHVYIFIYLQHF